MHGLQTIAWLNQQTEERNTRHRLERAAVALLRRAVANLDNMEGGGATEDCFDEADAIEVEARQLLEDYDRASVAA
jgi:hypothetical protein